MPDDPLHRAAVLMRWLDECVDDYGEVGRAYLGEF